MGRPRYGKDDDTAQDRIKRMFWEQLKETPYEKTTARNVAAAAFFQMLESLRKS